MITISGIEINNIRAIGHANVEPLIDGGITALNGPNGAGKSSVLCAVLWALYGVTPDGVPVSAMRRQGSTGDCDVTVTFEHDGQTVEVERGLKGAKDATYAKIRVDGREQAFGKVKAATDWVINRLGGLDAEGFLTAFVIRQKELDGLVKARPADRRRLIERLAGIDRMSTAVKSAREEETEVKRRLEVMPGSNEDVLAARQALDDAQQAAVDAWSTYEGLRDQAEADERALALAQAAAEQMDTRVRAHRDAVTDAQNAKHQADLAAQRADSADADVTRLRTEAQGGSADEVTAARAAHATAQEAVQANRDAREAADRAAADATREKQRAEQATQRAARAQQAARQATDLAAAARAKADAYPADLAAQATAAQAEASTLMDQAGALRGEWERLAASIKALTGVQDPHCPTCATNLADPAALLETLKSTQERVAAEGKDAKTRQQQAAAQVEALSARVAEAARAVQDAEHAATQAERARAEAAQAEADAAPIVAEAARLATVAGQAAAAAQAAQKNTATVQEALDTAARALRRAENAADAAARLPKAEESAAAARQAAGEADAQATVKATAEQQARVPEDEAQQVRAAHAEAMAVARASGQAAATALADHRVAEQNVVHAERTRDAEEAKVRAREETFRALEVKTAVREALDEFRKDRIARIAPELSEVATDFVSRMTDGKYVAVELDEEFTPVVTDAQGRMRPVAWLSGGEESAVALALRVAIGELIAGTRGGLLWMDEPFTAQDATRRPAMMAAIRELPGRQVVTINHASEATDMVDLVLDVIPDEENGSTIVPASSYGVVDEATLDAEELAA